jgi:hypothetical protein
MEAQKAAQPCIQQSFPINPSGPQERGSPGVQLKGSSCATDTQDAEQGCKLLGSFVPCRGSKFVPLSKRPRSLSSVAKANTIFLWGRRGIDTTEIRGSAVSSQCCRHSSPPPDSAAGSPLKGTSASHTDLGSCGLWCSLLPRTPRYLLLKMYVQILQGCSSS